MSKISLQLTADGSYTLCRGTDRESYHSRFGAVTEAREVFLRNSAVEYRLRQHLPTSVLEIGFGSGLNFMISACCARQSDTHLRYTGYEVAVPCAALMTELLKLNTTGCNAEIDVLQSLLKSTPTDKFHSINRRTELRLILADALNADFPHAHYHAIYLDAFSNAVSPEFWQVPMLKKLYRTLVPNGTLATYSVNRSFKDALSEAGFKWQKLPGPGGKREVIAATRV